MSSTETGGIAEPRRLSVVSPVKSVVGAGTTGNSVKVRNWPCTVSLVCSGSSGKVQYTTSTYEDIDAGTAVWQDWSRGVIAATASDIPEGPITGLRGVSGAGAVTLEVVQ